MFKPDLVRISFVDESRGVWRFANGVSKGTKFTYEVDDDNYLMRNRWEFTVQVPDEWTKGHYISVRPIKVPNRTVWAGLDRRTIEFNRATIGRHSAKVYAKLSISDVRGEKTRLVLTKDQKPIMLRWLREFSPVQKQRVTASAGKDGEHLVVVLDRDDHLEMIRLFLALKAWVLDHGYDPRESRLAAARRGLREKRSKLASSLRGKVITVTGRLGYGTRETVRRWLKRLGAYVADHATSKTDVLLVGAHYLGDDRVKIQYAKTNGIPVISEARFRAKYVV